MTRYELNVVKELLAESASAAAETALRIASRGAPDLPVGVRLSEHYPIEVRALRERIEAAVRALCAEDETAPPAPPPAGQYRIEYRGSCRTYSIAGRTFSKGVPAVVTDADLAERLKREEGFLVVSVAARPESGAAAG
jgi:hypothetical protein